MSKSVRTECRVRYNWADLLLKIDLMLWHKCISLNQEGQQIFLGMSSYFRLRCCQTEATKNFIIFSSLIIICLGGVHFGYCGVIGSFVKKYDNPSMEERRGWLRAMLVPHIAYIASTGILQVLVSFGTIALACSCACRHKQHIWRRIFLMLLILIFALNFGIATQTSMSSIFYPQYWKVWMDYPEQQYKTLSNFTRGWLDNLIVFIRYTKAEAIITFVLGLPLIAINIIALLDHYLKREQIEYGTSPHIPQVKGSAVEFQQRQNPPM